MQMTTPQWLAPQRRELAQIALQLDQQFHSSLPSGYLQGKTALRDALMDDQLLSAVDAERLIDSLQLQGFLHYAGDPTAPPAQSSGWHLEANGGVR